MQALAPRIFISAPKKSSGKTRTFLGLARAFKKQGKQVQGFKKGPDFIDPLWQSLATGRPSYNLDPWMMPQKVLKASFLARSQGADINLIEGNHGLHDGLSEITTGAGLAKTLNTPVLLVVDGSGMNRAVAAEVLGQMRMRPQAKFAGVILNRIKSNRQEAKQRSAIEEYCGLPVFGALPQSGSGLIPERHLGLITPQEQAQGERVIESLSAQVVQHCEVARIFELAQKASCFTASPLSWPKTKGKRVPIGVLRNSAFCFYYPENLEALEKAGGELIFLDPIRDHSIPEIEGLVIGGGFPESFLLPLAKNQLFLEDLKKKARAGLPIYAECGGLIYLAETASWQGREYPMAGLLPGRVEFSAQPQGYGYMELNPLQLGHWLRQKGVIRAHEFHYSRLVGGEGLTRLYGVVKGEGLGEGQDGIWQGNLFASYAHLHALATPHWAPGWIQFCRQQAS